MLEALNIKLHKSFALTIVPEEGGPEPPTPEDLYKQRGGRAYGPLEEILAKYTAVVDALGDKVGTYERCICP